MYLEKFKIFLKNFSLIIFLINLKHFYYAYKNFFEVGPPFIKRRIIKKFSSKDTFFVETGTNRGEMFFYLNKFFYKCYSIEPSNFFYQISYWRLKKKKNVYIFKGTSENKFKDILNLIISEIKKPKIVFYLDAHYDGLGTKTFKNKSETPIIYELNLIEKYLKFFDSCALIIDDYRNFGKNQNYPTIDFLLNYYKNNFSEIVINQDMLILTEIKRYLNKEKQI